MKKKFCGMLVFVIFTMAFTVSANVVTIEMNNLAKRADEIYYSIPGTLHIKQGEEPSLKVEVDEEYKNKLDIYTSGDSLYLKVKSNWFSTKKFKADIYLTVRNIEYIRNSSAGNIQVDGIKVGDLEVKCSSAGKIDFESIQCKDLEVTLSSVGEMTVKNDVVARGIEIDLSSSGSFNTKKITGRDMELDLGSSGSFNAGAVELSGDIDVDISNSGKVKINKLKSGDIVVVSSSIGSFYADIDKSMQKKVDLKTSSSGNICLNNVDTGNLEAIISSSGEVEVTGKAKEIYVRLSSSGNFEGENLIAEKAKIRNSSSGSIKTNVTDKLELRSSGSGDIYLKGEPKMNINKTGSGRLICIDKNLTV